MERPGLQALLADVDTRLIDVVVVYKIDRLTRSLPDFARIVERFDAKEVSFVSVTQSFNTTSSMGRLTLNKLLSFAQFEREVTGERIRDKIAASKAKGLWMGGNLPLGYDLPKPGTRILEVNESEAKTVRHIFMRYLALGSVHTLRRELANDNITSKRWTTSKGNTVGGVPFNRGALFHLLRNPLYLGCIRHKDALHEGEHEAIIDQELFDKVQNSLDKNTVKRRGKRPSPQIRSHLTGKLFDATGKAMSPVFTHGRGKTIYRYYVSASLQQGDKSPDDGVVRRIGASDLEKVLTGLVQRWLPNSNAPLKNILAVRLREAGILIDLPAKHHTDLTPNLNDDEAIVHAGTDTLRIALPLQLPLRGGKRRIIAGSHRPPRPDRALIAALRKSHDALNWQRGVPSCDAAPAAKYQRQKLRLALLAPHMQRGILTGHQPPSFTLEALKSIEIPICWVKQRDVLAWPKRK